uniref:Uncharacterized protein n=1 Tax=Opuntia streptacantha TaxID=393608 RepID=A0A7C9EFR5_OPUST
MILSYSFRIPLASISSHICMSRDRSKSATVLMAKGTPPHFSKTFLANFALVESNISSPTLCLNRDQLSASVNPGNSCIQGSSMNCLEALSVFNFVNTCLLREITKIVLPFNSLMSCKQHLKGSHSVRNVSQTSSRTRKNFFPSNFSWSLSLIVSMSEMMYRSPSWSSMLRNNTGKSKSCETQIQICSLKYCFTSTALNMLWDTAVFPRPAIP